MIEALINSNNKHWTMDSSMEKNNLICGEYKYRAYHTILLLKAETQIIQTLDFLESTDMKQF